ncbi:MAG: PAAR domain-containing protein [Iphinoe sp. HA4291-MV1]|nr:PAAR domain-containing protein [Iphinoe sp. HA4291-MV1]
MGLPAAKYGDKILAIDIHLVIVPPPLISPVPMPFPFNGIINGNLSRNVKIMGMPAATVDSTAFNTPPHIPIPPITFQKPPSNKATIRIGSPTVRINGKMAARAGDMALTCNDPIDLPIGRVIATGTVFIG